MAKKINRFDKDKSISSKKNLDNQDYSWNQQNEPTFIGKKLDKLKY